MDTCMSPQPTLTLSHNIASAKFALNARDHSYKITVAAAPHQPAYFQFFSRYGPINNTHSIVPF